MAKHGKVTLNDDGGLTIDLEGSQWVIDKKGEPLDTELRERMKNSPQAPVTSEELAEFFQHHSKDPTIVLFSFASPGCYTVLRNGKWVTI